MLTLGIDLASQPRHTAACLLEWKDTKATILELHERCRDSDLDSLISQSDAIGIDAPLGWPLAFRKATRQWPHKKWNNEIRDQLRFRETDRFVRTLHPKNRPLSVSTDLIALPAMRAMAILERHQVRDRSGREGRFFEVYPAATLRVWDLPATGYKNSDNRSISCRQEIINKLHQKLPQFIAPADQLTQSADVLDAWLAALTTRAAALGQTHQPPNAKAAEYATEEGWIHVPTDVAFLQD
ncbi:MAG: DUF429 domain-containing protein [Verrucomicrobiota bacterium]